MRDLRELFRTRGKTGSLQALHGILGRTENGLKTAEGEILFFRVSPSNLSVLSEEETERTVDGLKLLLEAEPDVEMLCVDAVENLTENRRFLEERLEREESEPVRRMLEDDRAFFEDMQNGMAPSRDFLLLLRLSGNPQGRREGDASQRARAFAKTAAGCGLSVTPATGEDAEDLILRWFGLPAPRREETFPGARRFAVCPDTKPFADRITPAAMQFTPEGYRCGESFRCVWAVRGYPPVTAEQGLLSGLGDRRGVTVHVYVRPVSAQERNRLLQNAERRNRWRSASGRLQEAVDGEENIRELSALIADRKRENGTLTHCVVFLELRASSAEELHALQSEVLTELTRCRLMPDRLILRQREGFLSVLPCGRNAFREEFERVLPSSSVANLYPFRYSGKTDPHGLYIGRDKYGTGLFVDTDRRDGDKTNGNVLILGNSGQGKSYLMKLLLINAREAGKRVIVVDPEGEYKELTEQLGGVCADLMDGETRINPLEVRRWSEDPDGTQDALPAHLAFLKDFFRVYRDFPDEQLDVIELLLADLYASFQKRSAGGTPTLGDLYKKAEREYAKLKNGEDCAAGRMGCPEQLLRDVCLSLHSLCVGAESRFFNGQTAVSGEDLVCVGMRGIHACNRRLKDALLLNLFAYIHHRLIADGNTVAAVDELYLFLTNPVALDYLRSAMKRVRKRDSAVWLSSQNIEDFLLPGIREYTAPLFSIPSHQFLFHPGNVPPATCMELLQLGGAEFECIRRPERGTCLYRCGNERYLLQVHAPEHKERLFGAAGGR